MDTTLLKFIGVLRKARLPIGSDEAVIAAQTVALLGYQDRGALRDALGMVLAKNQQHTARFEELFDVFFSSTAAPPGEAGHSPGERDIAQHALSEQLEDLLQADDDALRMAVQRAGEDSGVEDIRLFTQRGIYMRRILEALDWPILQDALISGAESVAGGAMQANTLRGFSARLRAVTRNYVEQQYALHGKPQTEQLREQLLMSTQIRQLDQNQIRQCRELVARIVKRLLKRFKRRKRLDRRGVLDVRRTLRHNMSTDGILFKPYWRRTHKERPQVFVLCDVSGSVRQYAELMMLFMHSIQDILPRVNCYAFTGRLQDVSDIFSAAKPEIAIAQILQKMGGGATDYGHALGDFAELAGHKVKHNSVLIVLGDARNNKSDPRLDIFSRYARAAGRTYWLNPESALLWDSGDSVMGAYDQWCNGAFEVGTLEQLEEFCEYLLRHTL